jgi:FixJ family two-component response regulator
MPGLSGLELQDWLIKRGFSTSFVLVTAFPDERCYRRALDAGAVGCLTKPFEEDSLVRCLTAAVGRTNASAGLQPVQAVTPPSSRG